jgi:agmatine/peptidylarginine deiminase
MSARFRLPAEWEPQAAVLLAWPHAGTDWAERLPRIEAAYVALAAAIARFEPVLICVPDVAVRVHAAALLGGAGVDTGRVRFLEVEYDDTWLRDSGPLTLAGENAFRLVDFRFTGWGGKFEGSRDDRLIEALDAERVLWLDHGYLEGDDTDAHIDTLARFAPDDAIVFQTCNDPADPHYAELARMHEEIANLRTADGRPYRLHPLPWAQAIVDEGRRLASSYANYLIVNDAVIMPAYGDASDIAAARVVAAAHPGREVVLVDARPLIWQNGSVHCLTMQLPIGLVAADNRSA